MFANGSSTVYYDDLSLVHVPVPCDATDDIPWVSLSPTNGTTTPGSTSPVAITFDSSGLALGLYQANLCVSSNDPDPGPGNGTRLVVVPLELSVVTSLPSQEIPTLGEAGAAFFALALVGLGLHSMRRRRE